MHVIPFEQDHIPAAANLFIQRLKQLRQTVPLLPDLLEKPDAVIAKLEGLTRHTPTFAAIEQDTLVGYMGAYMFNGFRGTERKVAYCPEWGHAVTDYRQSAIYRALYRAAAAQWTQAGCQLHAISLLAHDPVVEKTWFWNGFGLFVVDAIRPMTPICSTKSGFTVRKATLEDVETLVALEDEHRHHYAQPPLLMAPVTPDDAVAITEFINTPQHSMWLAENDGVMMGYARFEKGGHGTAAIVASETIIANTGLYVRPEFRGRGIAVALLNEGIQDYAKQGFTSCSVDFESFNPEAATFWMKHFTPVCLSTMRVPESVSVPEMN